MNSILHVLAFVLFAIPAFAQCPPVLLNCTSGPKEVCDETNNDPLFWNASYWWHNNYETHDLPETQTNLQISVLDTCQAGNISIRYTLELDLDANGTRETIIDSDELPDWNTVYFDNAGGDSLTAGEARQFDARPVMPGDKYGFALETLTNGDTISARVRWNTESAPDNFVLPQLPYGGQHRIVWTVTQGNHVQTCAELFSVEDCQKPEVVCINGLSVNILNTHFILLWDSDFLQYTGDNITAVPQLVTGIRKSGTGTGFPFNPDGTPQKTITYTCDDLGTNIIELWSMDLDGNAGVCETYVIVQDNTSICGDPGMSGVCIKFHCNGEPMDEIRIGSYTAPQPGIPPIFNDYFTGLDGCWVSPTTPLLPSYTVTPGRDNDPLNGVSTFDLIFLNKHILGIEPLNTPYQMIAADANASRSLTTFDIVEIRKLLLGLYTEFPNNTSWRFIPADYVFPNPQNPFQQVFPENYTINNTTQFQVEFVGVKVGDLNCNAVPHSFSEPLEERTIAALALPNAGLAAGQEFETELYLPEGVEWQGLQFALEFDSEKISLEQVIPGDIPGLDETTFARPYPGILTLSWFDMQSRQFEAGMPVLKLRWRANAAVSLSEVVRFSPKQLNPEAYDGNEQIQTLQLLFRDASEQEHTIVFKPQPNPTAESTEIPLQLAASATVTAELYDLNGRLVFRVSRDLPEGLHRIEIPAEALPKAGVYSWKIQTGEAVHSGKLLRI